MKDSKELFEDSLKLFPGGVNSPVRKFDPYPVFISSGKGSKLYDTAGKEYLDYCLAFGPMILGHSNPAILDAVKKQVELATLTGTPSSNEIVLASKLKGAVPALEKLRFANTGSEAVFHAIRLARAFTGRSRIVKFWGSYHGAHDYSLVTSDSEGNSIPSSPGVPDQVASTVLISEYGDINSLKEIFSKYGNDIAAVIVEPIMANTGLIEPDTEFLKSLREICSGSGSLLIFDEVVTGFRSSYGCYHDSIGIKPDLVTMSKIIGGGLPLAVFGGRRDIMEHVSPSGKVYVAGTFSGNPLSAAAGIATLDELKKKDYGKITGYADRISRSITDLIEQYSINATVNHSGSMFQIFFTDKVGSARESVTADREKYRKLFNFALSQGIYFPPSQFETQFVSFEHSDSDMEKTLQVVEEFFRNGMK